MTESKKSIERRISMGVGGALVEFPPERVGWANPIEFVLSCIGYAVGIGNVWRFPYLIHRNGGGAFLIPFCLILLTMGLPIFFLELVVGQYTGLGPSEAFARILPAFQGLGYCTLVVIAFVTIYYMIIISWTLFYMFASFCPTLKWASCDNPFNTGNCYSGLQSLDCRKRFNESYIYYRNNCTTLEGICRTFDHETGNGTHCFLGNNITELSRFYKPVSSSEEYFNNYVLGRDETITWEHFGSIRWELFGCLTLAWIVCYFCLNRGIQSIGKIVYFTALFPYVVLFALLVRGATLEGAGQGVLWYITPKWEKLLDINIWADAASQVFYSLGIGCGSLVVLASYSSFGNNCHRDAIFVTLANLLTSVFAGFVIYSVMGFLAVQMQLPIEKVVQSETGLAFIAYPEAVVRMPLPNLWAVLFFFMLFILGLGSQFAGIQALSSAVLDLQPDWRKHESYVVLLICVACWLLGIPMIFQGGVYLFELMNWNTASWAILLIGFAEVVAASWFYGCNKFLDNISEMGMRFGIILRGYWWISWVVLAPLTCLVVFVYQLYMYNPPKYQEYVFPAWANWIGILIGLSTLVPLPIFFACRLFKGPIDRSLFEPSKSWGPRTVDTKS